MTRAGYAVLEQPTFEPQAATHDSSSAHPTLSVQFNDN